LQEIVTAENRDCDTFFRFFRNFAWLMKMKSIENAAAVDRDCAHCSGTYIALLSLNFGDAQCISSAANETETHASTYNKLTNNKKRGPV
jgi:hypothetical protein